MSKEIAKFADEAMYESEEMPFDVQSGPKITLLNATADPYGSNAAMSMMYEGKVARSLDDITDEERRHYFEQIKKTHLKAPWESIHFHFLLEGVTRSFTHQMVRQRTAVYAQESLRFAVKEHIDEEVALPPSLLGLAEDDPRVRIWKKAINAVDDAYNALVSNDIPAEDARGLLPHNITTRIHYVTNLRGLQEHMGNRLCTQAQFEWRLVALGIVKAIREYGTLADLMETRPVPNRLEDNWQFEELSRMFQPVCYNVGHCVFGADFDRKCSIRERVQQNAAIGRPSSEWSDPAQEYDEHSDGPEIIVDPIHPSEWLADPTAAR